MRMVACAAPIGSIEPAPLTSLPISGVNERTRLTAFWAGDDAYYVRVEQDREEPSWYRVQSEEWSAVDIQPVAMSLGNDVISLGAGRVAFPAGSSGRTVYRVWRSRGSSRLGKTRILAVRAGRSRRLPA
jgi:hypothetical protein